MASHPLGWRRVSTLFRGYSRPPALVWLLVFFLSTSAAAQHPAGVEPGESYQRVFATSNVFGISSSTTFPPPFTAINGLAGADWHVTLAAFSAGILSEWNGLDPLATAILSTSTVDANTRFSIAGKVFNTQDEKIADSSSDFWDGSLDAAIRYDEHGVAVNSSEVWSGSNSGGDWSGESCGDWTDSSGGCSFGDAFTAGSAWLLSNSQSGSNTARLYGISPAVTLPNSADFNGDNLVDGIDFLTWQENLGTVGPLATHAKGDANGDDLIDAADLAVWESQYGSAPPVGAVVGVVPEPASILLASLAGLFCCCRKPTARASS